MGLEKYVRQTVLSKEERFWIKVNKEGPIPINKPHLGCCWLWTAGLVRDGYGQFAWGKPYGYRAHIISYRLLIGNIPKSLELDHLCGIKNCVRPSHLEAVTHKVNMEREKQNRDMQRRQN